MIHKHLDTIVVTNIKSVKENIYEGLQSVQKGLSLQKWQNI